MEYKPGDLAPRQHDRLRVPFPDIRYDRPDELVAAIQAGRRVWLISDTHFFHHRLWHVLRPTAEGGREPRNTEMIMANWRQMVHEDDFVLHLGDVTLGLTSVHLPELIGHLPGKIFLLLGNHDRSLEKSAVYRSMGYQLLKPFAFDYQERTIQVSHEPIQVDQLGENEINLHGHIHHNPAYDERHLNACIEQLGYAPVELRPLLDRWLATLPAALPRPEGHGNGKGKK